MTGGHDTLYKVTNDVTKKNKKFNCDERIIQLKSTDHQISSFEEAVEFFHNYIDSIHLKSSLRYLITLEFVQLFSMMNLIQLSIFHL